MKKIIKCLMIIIGTLIGAGFASGQEIVIFFNKFSNKGVLGIIIASILFGLITFLIMDLSRKSNINEYKKLINNKFIVFIIKAFTFICFCIMISAIGAYANEQYNFNFWIATSIAGVICFIAFLLKFYGLEKINNILVPIILIGIMMLAVVSNKSIEEINISKDNLIQVSLLNNWIQAAILYVGYNAILLIPILFELRIYKMNKKEISILGAFVSLVLCLTGLLIFFTLNKYYPEIMYAEIPTLMISKLSNNFVFWYYNFVILFAIFTTAFSCGYAFLKLSLEKNYFRNCLLLCFFGIILARIGFSNLVNIFFPIFGYLGLIQIIFLMFNWKKIS